MKPRSGIVYEAVSSSMVEQILMLQGLTAGAKMHPIIRYVKPMRSLTAFPSEDLWDFELEK